MRCNPWASKVARRPPEGKEEASGFALDELPCPRIP